MAMDIDSIVKIVINIVVMLVSVVVIGALAYVVYKWNKRRTRFNQFRVIIWGKDGFGQITETHDKAGIFTHDTTKNKRLYLQRNNVGLSPDSVPYVQSGNVKKIYLLQTGLKNFRFIKPKFEKENFRFDVGEDDVNWALDAYEQSKKVFAQSTLLQYMPYIMLVVAAFSMVIIFYFLFKRFDVINDVALNLKEAAVEIAKARTGTVVVQ